MDDDAHPTHRVATRPQPGKGQFRTRRAAVAIVGAVCGALAVVALPGPGGGAVQSESLELRTTELALARFRGALDEYFRDHGAWPGCPPVHGPTLSRSDEAEVGWLGAQLLTTSDVDGRIAPGLPFGPYLGSAPENPLNGLSTVRVLARSEGLPAEADGRTGWIYDAHAGVLRLNATGTWQGVRWYDR